MSRDPLVLEEEIPQETINNVEVIENISSPEELQATKELLKQEAPKEDKPTEKKSEEKPEEEEPKKDEAPKEDAPVEDKAEDKAVITEKVINSFPEEDRKILKNFLGKPIEDALKSLVNAQRLVGKKTEAILKGQPQQEEKPKVTPEAAQKADEVKSTLLKQQLKSKYPDMPEDPEELKTWEKDFGVDDPRGFQQYLNDEHKFSTEITEHVTKMVDFRNNYENNTKSLLNAGLGKIESILKDKFKIDPKETGYDFTPVDSFDNNNQLLNELLLDENGNPDPNVMPTVTMGNDRFYMIDTNQMLLKFFDKNLDKALSFREVQASKEALKARDEKKKVETLADKSAMGEPRKEESLSEEEINNLTDPQKLAELKKKLEQKLK